MYLAATRGTPVLFGQIRHNEAPEIQVPVRRRPEEVFDYYEIDAADLPGDMET